MNTAVSFFVLFGFFGAPGVPEMLIILVIGVLLFGKRLPEVGRSLGKGIMEFKKGISGIEEEIESAISSAETNTEADYSNDYDEATAPKFEPPDSEPKDEAEKA